MWSDSEARNSCFFRLWCVILLYVTLHKGDRHSERPKLTTGKLPADVLHRTKVIAAQRNSTIAGIIGEVMRPALDKMEHEYVARFIKQTDEKTRLRQ